MEKIIIKGIAEAMTPVVHDEILKVNAPKESGEAAPFRSAPFILYEQEDGAMNADTSLPVISGNSIRGKGRGLLVKYSLEDVLQINLREFYGNDAIARRIAFMFYKGGLTDSGSTIKPAAIGVYDKIRNNIPWFGCLGGFYTAHQFESDSKIGFLIPVTKGTAKLYDSIFHLSDEAISKLPTAETIRASIQDMRYARHCLGKFKTEGSGEDEFAAAAKKANDDAGQKNTSESMIFGKKALPAGTKFFSVNTCISDNPGTILAFKAMMALVQQYGFVGGMSNRGHGQMLFNFEDFDAEQAIKDYREYLLAHKDSICEAMHLIADELHFDNKHLKEAQEKEKKEKKEEK